MAAAADPVALLRVVAARAPRRPAIAHLRNAVDTVTTGYSYAEAAEVAARFAAALTAAGVEAGDTVAIVAPSVPEMLLAIMGAASVAVAFPLNLLLSPEAMAGQLRLAKCRAIVAFGAHADLSLDATVAEAIRLAGGVDLVIELDAGGGRSAALADSAACCVSWSEFISGADPASAKPVVGDRTAALFHTGGTTGAPKLAELSLDGLMASAHASSVGLGWREDDRVLELFPFFHVGGAITLGLSQFSAGATLVNCGLAGARDPDVIAGLWKIAARLKISVICVAPPTWSLIAAQPAPQPWPELRGVLTGAATIAPVLARRVAQLAGVPLSQCLGMTELCGACANQPLDGAERELAVGFPMPLIETRLQPISPGGPMELHVRGPMMFRGYRSAVGRTGVVGEGWYATGDLAEILPDGQLRLVGRAKDVIIRGGHNIDPLSIEEVVCRHPAIVTAAAVGMPDAFAGEVPVVYAVRKTGDGVCEAVLAAYIAERIEEPPARPKRITFVDALPLTAVGKVARYRLRQAAAATRVRELLSEVAGVGDVRCDDLGARRVTIAWLAEPDDAVRGSADAAAAPLGVTLDHVTGQA